jgi:hypothetical protein
VTTFAGRAIWPQPFMDRRGNKRAGLVVTVYEAGTLTAATLYTDRTKSDTLPSNSTTTDGQGNLWLYLDPGDYDALIDGVIFPLTVVEDPEDASAGSAGLPAHLSDAVDAHDASAVSFVPAAGVAATNVQAAVVEVAGDTTAVAADLAALEAELPGTYDQIGAAAAAAAASVPKSLVDAAGDLLVGTADNTVGRLAKGSALQVLRVNAGATGLEWAAESGGGGDVTQAELDDGLALKLDIADAAPLSADDPLPLSAIGAAGASGTASDAGHVHPWDGLVVLNPSLGLDLAGSLTVAGAFASPGGALVAKNLQAGPTSAIFDFVGYAQDGTTRTSMVDVAGFFRGEGFASRVFNNDADDVALQVIHDGGGSPIYWRLRSGAYRLIDLGSPGTALRYRSPDGAASRDVSLANDGTMNVSAVPRAASFAANDPLVGVAAPNGTIRSRFGGTGALVLTNDPHNGEASHDAIIALEMNWWEVGTRTANLWEIKKTKAGVGTTALCLLNNDGEWENQRPGKGSIAQSPDGTRYRLAPPNGGGAATWVAA